MSKVKYLLPLLILTACSHVQALAISGTTIGTLGDTFVDTATAFDKALDNGTITPDEYAKWKVFGLKFQMSFQAAVQLWHVAVITNDAIMEQHAISLIQDLQAPLLEFATDIYKLTQTRSSK